MIRRRCRELAKAQERKRMARLACQRVVNPIDLDKVEQMAIEGKKDHPTPRRKVVLQREWNLDQEKGYQFRTEMQYERGNR